MVSFGGSELSKKIQYIKILSLEYLHSTSILLSNWLHTTRAGADRHITLVLVHGGYYFIGLYHI